MWPMSASMVLSGVPASAILVAAVWRKSWRRHFTPAWSLKASHALEMSVIGRAGSLGIGFPKGKR
jgi:hypothetical protein